MALPEGPAGGADETLAERVDSLATWIGDLEARLRVAEVATGDEKTARELRKALEALSKHDPKLEKRVTDHVTVVTQRFDTLASTVASTAATLAAREGEVAGLRRELEDARRKTEELARQAGSGADAKEIARLRGIVDALSAQRPARAADSRVNELGTKVRMLAERVDSLTATVSANAAALGRRDQELATMRERIDAGTQKIETVGVELRRLQHDDSLTERLDALQVALVGANGAIADREQEAEQLRARIDEAYSHVGEVVKELQRTIGELAGQVTELQALPRTAAAALEQRAATLDGRIDGVAGRLEEIAAGVESGLAGIAERDAQLTGLYRDVEAERARVDALVAGLEDELNALPDPLAGHAEIEARLETLRAAAVAVTARLDEMVETLSARADAETERVGAVDHALGLLSDRLDAVERERESAVEQLRRADEVWLQERDWVRRQLERLAESQEETTQASEGLGPALEELRGRLDVLDAERGPAAERLDALTVASKGTQEALEQIRVRLDGSETERGALAARLDELAVAVADLGSRDSLSGEEAGGLATRIADVERRGTIVASELAQSTALWASELAALGERLDRVGAGAREETAARLDLTDRLVGGLSARLEALEQDRPPTTLDDDVPLRVEELAARLARVESAAQSGAAAAAVAAAASPDEELEEVRALLDGVVTRVSATEQSVASVSSDATSLKPVLEALAKRIETTERAAMQVPALASDGADQGDGRFRLELRAFELRMEHAEAAARENREAVLTQLERLASRVEWRLQRLEEAAQAGSFAEPAEAGAQVVPIRGGADTS